MSDLDDEDRDDIDEEDSQLDDVDTADGGDDEESIEMEEGEELDAVDDDTEGELRAAEEELSHRDQNARSLAVRRAIEQRMEQKRLAEDLDYLDLDLED